MRITGGLYRNVELKTLAGELTRPTSSKVRSAVMNMLTGLIQDAVFFDFFSGSGAMSFEALSRGAKKAYLYEKDQKAARVIRENIKMLTSKFGALSAELVCADVFDLLKQPPKKHSHQMSLDKSIVFKEADIVWMDPPYALVIDWVQILMQFLEASKNSRKQVFVLESSIDDLSKIIEMFENCTLIERSRHKKYGATAVFIFETRMKE